MCLGGLLGNWGNLFYNLKYTTLLAGPAHDVGPGDSYRSQLQQDLKSRTLQEALLSSGNYTRSSSGIFNIYYAVQVNHPPPPPPPFGDLTTVYLLPLSF